MKNIQEAFDYLEREVKQSMSYWTDRGFTAAEAAEHMLIQNQEVERQAQNLIQSIIQDNE